MMERNDGGPAFPYSALQPDEKTRQLVGTMYADAEWNAEEAVREQQRIKNQIIDVENGKEVRL